MTSVNSFQNAGLDLIEPQLELLDFEPADEDVLGDVLAGLMQPEKTLPCKLFYDQQGSM